MAVQRFRPVNAGAAAYPPSLGTVSSNWLDKALPSVVQMEWSAAQSGVMGKVMTTLPSLSGLTVISNCACCLCLIRRAPVTSPLVTPALPGRRECWCRVASCFARGFPGCLPRVQAWPFRCWCGVPSTLRVSLFTHRAVSVRVAHVLIRRVSAPDWRDAVGAGFGARDRPVPVVVPQG